MNFFGLYVSLENHSYLKTSPIECVILSSLFKKCASLMLLQKFFHKLFAKREFFMIFFSFFAVFTILCLIAIYFRTPMLNRYFEKAWSIT